MDCVGGNSKKIKIREQMVGKKQDSFLGKLKMRKWEKRKREKRKREKI